jgi:hypothetical protein
MQSLLGSERLHRNHVIVVGPHIEVSHEMVALSASRRDRCTDATSHTTSGPNSVQGTRSEVYRRCSALAVSFSSMLYREFPYYRPLRFPVLFRGYRSRRFGPEGFLFWQDVQIDAMTTSGARSVQGTHSEVSRRRSALSVSYLGVLYR